MQFKRSVTTVRTWQLYGGPVVCSYTDGGSCGEVTSIRGWVCLLETEIQKWGTNLVSTVWTTKYKERNKFWCEQMFVKFNCFFSCSYFLFNTGQEGGRIGGSMCGRNERCFSFPEAFRLRSATTNLFSVYCGFLFSGWNGRSLKLTTYFQPVLSYRMSGAVTQLLHTQSWRAQPQLCLFSSYNHILYSWEVWWGFPYRLMHTVTCLQHFVTFLLQMASLKPDTCKL